MCQPKNTLVKGKTIPSLRKTLSDGGNQQHTKISTVFTARKEASGR